VFSLIPTSPTHIYTCSLHDALPIFWSAQWHLPQAEPYRLTHVAGRWLDEFHLVREPLVPGNKVLESRRIITSPNHQPWFAVGLRSEEHTSELQSRGHLVCRLLLEKK